MPAVAEKKGLSLADLIDISPIGGTEDPQETPLKSPGKKAMGQPEDNWK